MTIHDLTENQLHRLYRRLYRKAELSYAGAFGMDFRTIPKALALPMQRILAELSARSKITDYFSYRVLHG